MMKTYFMLSIILFSIIIIYLIFHKFNNNNNDILNGCLYNRYGCCTDKLTPKLDQNGTNCRGF